MSTPPPDPSAYPYPNPQSPAGSPPGFGPPVPAQQNPYAQPLPQPVPQQPGRPMGQPIGQPGQYYGPQGPPIPQMPPPPGGGGAGRAVLWAAVGAVVASAFWGGGVLLLGGKADSAAADLKGYTAQTDLCTSSDISAFKTKYPQSDSSPTTYTIKHEALDDMYCDQGLKMTGSTYSDAYLSTSMELHKKSDPTAEFAAQWEGYSQRKGNYKVEKVTGFGDAAYLITEDTIGGSDTSGSRSVTLAVRDGWMTYQMRWSMYLSSLDKDKNPPSVSEVTGWVKSSTTASLPKLKA
ncbi:hypothetical protein QMK19_34990 [Streptomyces sp. H10-C2]|uniref:hypothetical protein n=1 Tax=unclassified Streptomyces TaxID=2593676 RepID=UPI0024B880ED|nr:MULTISPECIES: hypothetical protein [unclassified Streptomyces]MDJ0345800.1 hypothetical protein [Streptomyces sp. PH10-H1]MDJ0374690.1 hypothetical protein [Streptomyces sp. H10-C2]